MQSNKCEGTTPSRAGKGRHFYDSPRRRERDWEMKLEDLPTTCPVFLIVPHLKRLGLDHHSIMGHNERAEEWACAGPNRDLFSLIDGEFRAYGRDPKHLPDWAASVGTLNRAWS